MAYLYFKGRIKETPKCTGCWINTITVSLKDGVHITLDRDETEFTVDRPDGDEYARDFCHYECKWYGVYDVDMIDTDASYVDEGAYIKDDDILEYEGIEVVDVDIEAPSKKYALYIDEIEFLEDNYNRIGNDFVERPFDSCV